MDLKTGKERLVGNFPGMSFAPRFSPDGTKAIMSIAAKGATHIYIPSRSDINDDRKQWIKKTNITFNGNVFPIKCDIGIVEDLKAFFRSIKHKHDSIRGIYHSLNAFINKM